MDSCCGERSGRTPKLPDKIFDPTKCFEEVNIIDYDCVLLPGTINPLPALYDEKLIDFLRTGKNTGVLFASISSSPILLSKSGILDGKKFTSGYFMQMADTFPFVEKENFIHKPIVEDQNVIAAIGTFFREFAECVLIRLGYDVGSDFMVSNPDQYSEDDLTFYWTESDYKGFLEELKEYE